MATATLNPLLSSISGRIGNVVFYRRHNKQCIRLYVVPRNPDALLQKNVRKSFAGAVKSWQSLTDEEKYKFARKARRTHMSGYNLYISEFIKESISAGSRPEERLSFTELLNSSGIYIHIHSVSASLRFLFNNILTINQLKYNPG